MFSDQEERKDIYFCPPTNAMSVTPLKLNKNVIVQDCVIIFVVIITEESSFSVIIQAANNSPTVITSKLLLIEEWAVMGSSNLSAQQEKT